jgi:hypothetical protein
MYTMPDGLRQWSDDVRSRIRQWSLGKKILAVISAPLFVGIAIVLITALVNRQPGPPCVPNSVYVGEDKITDGARMAPNTKFTKTWYLRDPNYTGICTWTTEYNVVWINGPLMASRPTYFLAKQVIPGQDATIRIAMTAPAKPGEYKSTWILRTQQE